MQIQLKVLAEEMQTIIQGLEKVKQELAASAEEGPVSEVFHKVGNMILYIYISKFFVILYFGPPYYSSRVPPLVTS